MKKYVRQEDVVKLINTVKDGEFFSMFFKRVAPKCHHCNKANKKWVGLDKCPVCGEHLDYFRETVAQLGVSNPSNPNIRFTGTGVSAEEALEHYNNIKYYDVNAVDDKGEKGGYRTAKVDNIISIKIRGEEYHVLN